MSAPPPSPSSASGIQARKRRKTMDGDERMTNSRPEFSKPTAGSSAGTGLEKVVATIASGGGFFALKGVLQDLDPRQMTVWSHSQRCALSPYGAADQRSMFRSDRIAVEKIDGPLVAERRAPRDSFAGHQMNTPWDPLHRAYFNGEALWTYFTTPFLRTVLDAVRVEEIEPWRENGEIWRVLCAVFPGSIETHSLVQDFFFGHDRCCAVTTIA